MNDISEMNEDILVSFSSMEGIETTSSKDQRSYSDLSTISLTKYSGDCIDCVESLTKEIDDLFRLKHKRIIDKDEFRDSLIEIFAKIDLKTSQLNKYTFWDTQKPYTRNLIASDGTNYSLLLLCWSAGKESKIHNHPGEGCYMKTIRGTIKESRYKVDPVTHEIIPTKIKFLSENQVAYIDDSLGLHKIGNPSQDSGAVSLHLYTPPFKSVKVWLPTPSSPRNGKSAGSDILYYNDAQEATVGHYSMFGVRTPHMEGTYSLFLRVMKELLASSKIACSE